MSLFTAFNAVAETAAVRRQYRRLTDLPNMTLFCVASMEATKTEAGPCTKVFMDASDGSAMFLYVNMDLPPEACQEASKLHEAKTPAYFFTAFGNKRRVNGLIPFGKFSSNPSSRYAILTLF